MLEKKFGFLRKSSQEPEIPKMIDLKLNSVKKSDRSISSDSDNYTNEEEYYSTDEENTLLHVPLIENVVMGKDVTVIDEEHYLRPKRRASLQHMFATAEKETKKQTAGMINRIKIRYFNVCTRRKKNILFLSTLAAAVIGFAYQLEKRELQVNMSFPLDDNFYGEAEHGENEILKIKTSQDVQNLNFPGIPPPPFMELPIIYQGLSDLYTPRSESDMPLFWEIPRTGGGVLAEVMGYCLGLVQASHDGGNEKYTRVEKLKVIQLKNGKFINVDTHTISGIDRAKSLSLTESNLLDVVVSPFPYHSSLLFTQQHRGLLFTIVRHPVERAESSFYYRRWAHWDKTYDPQLVDMSIVEYAKSPRIEHNWMTRLLTGQVRGEITQDHLNLAKEILRRKCIIGLFDHHEETMRRFKIYFNWDDSERKQDCIDKMMMKTLSSRQEYSSLSKDSLGWELLMMRNRFDMELFSYARYLFGEQMRLFQ